MSKILYKYRSLENFKKFVDIILRKRLYAATYTELNDSNEGQYYFKTGSLDRFIIDKLAQEKEELRICSLSEVNDIDLLWAYYANGHRGVAIGVTIDESIYTVKTMKYEGLLSITNYDEEFLTAKEILSHKLGNWRHEKEERVFTRNEKFVNVEIKEVITGKSMNEDNYNFVKD